MSVLKFDPFSYRYPSRRNLVYGSRGMVATSQPLAASAGMEILKKGGNAVDAAVATAAALTVVEPTSNGIGGDAFAIVWHGGALKGLNASGPAPGALTIERAKSLGYEDALPRFGWAPAMVPGVPAAWAELSKTMGRLAFDQALAPAIEFARGGHAVSVNVSRLWKNALAEFSGLKTEEHRYWFETFCPSGRAPCPGERFVSPGHAHTLEQIASTGARSFYEGEIAERILAFSRKTGGCYAEEDLASFRPEWVDPIGVKYRGYDVWEIPPNGQGIVALMALGILNRFQHEGHDCPYTIHRQVEALKLGFADAHTFVADMKHEDVPVRELLSEAYTARRASLVGGEARPFAAGNPYSGGTVYLCTADGEGNMVSYIQSNYMGFGSAVVVPETGIALNNRGQCFSLDRSHRNALQPGKRPYNTIIPGFITKDGQPVGPLGVMGGFMQPQGHVQVVMNCVDFHMNPQEALDAPRWQWEGDMRVSCEPGFSNNTAQKLNRMGHDVHMALHSTDFGRGQMICRTPDGTLLGATEPRTDGAVEAW